MRNSKAPSLVGALVYVVFTSSALVHGQFSGHPDGTVTQSLRALDPPFEVLRNVDYNEAKPGQPAPGATLVDLRNGDLVAADITDCAVKCSNTPPCNMASWYGDSTFDANGRNCWLKELELVCQYPADLEEKDDDRYLLLARPNPECQNTALVADPVTANPPPPPPGASTASDKEETINTPEDKATILGNREMDPGVPAVWMIESGVSSTMTNSLFLLLVAPFLQIVSQL